jgi:hypothetical protein
MKPELPVRVLEVPHWRVRYRPLRHQANQLTLSEAWELIEKYQVRYRGWPFPHFSRSRSNQRQFANNWVAAWNEFSGHIEYWRFFQSKQFLYLGSVREKTESDWDAKLRAAARDSLEDIDSVPGFFSLTNLIYNVTEYFEFLARLCEAEVYSEELQIEIGLYGIKGFILAPNDHWWDLPVYAATSEHLENTWQITPADVVARSKVWSMEAITWIIERLGWRRPPVHEFSDVQEKLLARRI